MFLKYIIAIKRLYAILFFPVYQIHRLPGLHLMERYRIAKPIYHLSMIRSNMLGNMDRMKILVQFLSVYVIEENE